MMVDDLMGKNGGASLQGANWALVKRSSIKAAQWIFNLRSFCLRVLPVFCYKTKVDVVEAMRNLPKIPFSFLYSLKSIHIS